SGIARPLATQVAIGLGDFTSTLACGLSGACVVALLGLGQGLPRLRWYPPQRVRDGQIGRELPISLAIHHENRILVFRETNVNARGSRRDREVRVDPLFVPAMPDDALDLQ